MHRTRLKHFVPLILSILVVQCSSEDPRQPKVQAYHQLDSLNSLLVKELATHRVLMLGDSYPRRNAYAHVLTSFLHAWLNKTQESPHDTAVPRKVTLALEIEEQGEKSLNDYLRTGDRYQLMRDVLDEQLKFGFDLHLTWPLSVDYLQLCEELHLFKLRLDSLNRLNSAYPVTLDIIAGEPRPPYTYLDFRKLARRQFNAMKWRWEVSEQGREAALMLVQYLSQHPEQKVIFFAGASHLLRDTKDGFFTAHCIDSLIGRKLVSVFQTSRTSRTPQANPQIEEYKHDGETADYLVSKLAIGPASLPFFVVKSQNTFRALVDLAEKYSLSADTLEIDLSRKLLGKCLQLLRRSHLALTPARNQNIASLQSFVARATDEAYTISNPFPEIRDLISHFDAVQDIIEADSVMITFAPPQDFYDDLTTLIDNLPSNAAPVQDTLAVSIPKYEPPEAITARWAQSWKQKKSEIRTYMLLQILWLGTPAEVASAMKALQRETRQELVTLRQWDDWWRSDHRLVAANSK